MIPHHRILLADDDLEVRNGLAELLAPLGLEILQAEDGPEALEIVRVERLQLHLLMLDMHMPGFGGLEVLSRISTELEVTLPTIFCSGEATDEMEREALAAGARAFLRKPLQAKQVRGEVLRALNLRPDPLH